MRYTPYSACSADDRDLLKNIMRRYAARFYITGPDRDALVAQTISALAEEPEVLLDKPIERAMAETMHRLFMANLNLPERHQHDQSISA